MNSATDNIDSDLAVQPGEDGAQQAPSRLRALLEVLVGLAMFFGYFWLVNPLKNKLFHVICVIPFLALMVYSWYSRRETPRRLGIRLDTAWPSAKWLIPFSLLAVAAITPIWYRYFPVDTGFYVKKDCWVKFFEYLFSGFLQQLVFLGFFYRRIRDVMAPYRLPAILTYAIVFSLVHLPTPPLVIVCFLGGLFWGWVYERYPNLLTVSASHAFLGTVCSTILWMYTRVGPRAEPGHWVKHPTTFYGISTVGGKAPTWKEPKPSVTLPAEVKEIKIVGWMAGRFRKVDEMYVMIGDYEAKAEYGGRRDYVLKNYQEKAEEAGGPDNYLYSGFTCTVPVQGISPGEHRMRFRVKLKGRTFYWYPEHLYKVWVNIQQPSKDQ